MSGSWAPIPSDATVLFDGHDMSAWDNASAWNVADGVVTVGKGSIKTKEHFGDCHLHLEFRMPSPPKGKGPGRGNSGVFLMGFYEIPILDSYEDGTDGPLTEPHADALPIGLQDHDNPVQFRNIWVRRFEPVVPKPE